MPTLIYRIAILFSTRAAHEKIVSLTLAGYGIKLAIQIRTTASKVVFLAMFLDPGTNPLSVFGPLSKGDKVTCLGWDCRNCS